MEKKNHELLKKLLATFKVEAEEHVRAMSSGVLQLEKVSAAEKRMEIIEAVFREAHSLKGAARAVNMVEIEAICQSLESVFAALKRQDLSVSGPLLDRLDKAVDTVGKLVSLAGAERTAAPKFRSTEVIQGLENALQGTPPPSKRGELKKTEEMAATVPPQPGAVKPSQEMAAPPTLGEGRPILAETVRLSTAKMNALLLQAEELLSAKLAVGQRADELLETGVTLVGWNKQRAKIQSELRVLQHSLGSEKKENGQGVPPHGNVRTNWATRNVLEFVEWNDGLVKSVQSKISRLARSAEQDRRTLSSMVDTLLLDVKKALMLPFSSLLEGFPKLIRDLSRDRGKEVELLVQGSGIEADRRILEEMKDPLVHLVRNCIDHGIEYPKERERKKKPSRGTITIAVSEKDGDKVEIFISDDGAGVNVPKVRAAALKLGIVSEEHAQKMDEQEVLSLIFHSGVSTSPVITDLSGRGLGLAIAREKAERLGGAISLETRADVGTTFRILLPLTLATFRGILVRVDENLFILPTTNVERAVRVSKEEVKTVENRETIQHNGEVVSLVRLGDALELPRKAPTGKSTGHIRAVVLGAADKRVAFLVDELLHEQEVLIKGLGRQLSRLQHVAGAAVLGTGKVVPVLNVPDLMKSAVKVGAAASTLAVAAKQPQQRKSILIVEDSITARTLLKNILESAGYFVKTAVDGLDAFTTLRTEGFDLVVSDVDMPRMGGFDLTAKIRADTKLAQLPVVLVTALESREDRERGGDVGANAYIVKSSFDQSNLLEVIRRLI